MRHVVLGTAGHIDHGKTTLVQALTGVDTDRLPDEKRRGITIDIGFAALQLEDFEFGVVDVPGHEAFIRNMLAGATGMDLVLLVIAADEGVMPQTREHLAIMRLLGIRQAVVAVTKRDLVDDDWLELVLADISDTLGAAGFETAEIVPVSAPTGLGLDHLRRALAAAARHVPVRQDDDLFRMPVDRVFTIRGTGTVLTGSVWSGTLRIGDTIRLVPASISARVRGLQHHGRAVDRIGPGARAAVAVVGVDRDQVRRGDVLVTDDVWAPAGILTVRVTVLEGATLRHRQRVRVHLGTAEVLGRVALLDGGDGLVQLRLEQPLVARAGDRFVLRSYSPVTTVAGGIVIEPDAPRRRRLDPETRRLLEAIGSIAPSDRIRAAVELRGGVRVRELPVVAGVSFTFMDGAGTPAEGTHRSGELLLPVTALHSAEVAVVSALTDYHATHPLDDGKDREALRMTCGLSREFFEAVMREMAAAGTIRTLGGTVALAGHTPRVTGEAARLMDALLEVYERAGLQPPDLGTLPPEMVAAPDLLAVHRHLERTGRLLRLSSSQWIDAAAVAGASPRCVSMLRPGNSLECLTSGRFWVSPGSISSLCSSTLMASASPSATGTCAPSPG